MNPNNPTPLPTPQPDLTPSWMIGGTPDPLAPPPSPKKSRKKLYILIAAALVIIGGCAATFFFTMKPSSNCLTDSDFLALTGYASDEPVSSADFYTDYIAFKDGSSDDYGDGDDASHGAALISKIAAFYKNTPNKQMSILVTGDFSTPAHEALINQRIDTVYRSLLAEGVPDRDISVKDATATESESETEEEPRDNVYISISGDFKCK